MKQVSQHAEPHAVVLNEKEEKFHEILRYTLTFFHLVCRSDATFLQNHERTYFVENLIPSLLVLAKSIGFLEFKWCETEFLAKRTPSLSEFDYDLRSVPASKMSDAIGTMTTQHNLELVIVEASSGRVKENVNHTIEDTLKLLECGLFALRKEAHNYKDASLETFKKLKVFVVQCIKTQVTLSELSLENVEKWKFAELKNGQVSDNLVRQNYAGQVP